MKEIIGYAAFCLLIIFIVFSSGCVSGPVVENFDECVAMGYPVMESYPRQCRTPDGRTFTEEVALEMSGELCRAGGGNWNECSNRCQLDNQGKQGIACTMQCEALCECGGIAGFNCPAGFACKMIHIRLLQKTVCIKSLFSCPSGYWCKMPEGIDVLGYCVLSQLSEQEAIQIAQASDCTGEGTLTENAYYNGYTGTWWIDLESNEEKQGCNPACVVSEDRTAEINWRCTGALSP